MTGVQPLELFGVIEEVLANHRAFGDSAYIREQFHLWQKDRLTLLANRLPSARRLLDVLDGTDAFNSYCLIGNTVVRCAIRHALIRIEDDGQYGLSLPDCERVFDAAALHLELGNLGTPLESGMNRLPCYGAEPYHGWIWSEQHTDDVFGQSFKYLIQQNFGDSLCAPSADEVTGLAAGAQLLHNLVPSLASSALSHVHLIGCFPDFGFWKEKQSSSQFKTGGTIFLSQRSLRNPWWVAEHLLHEALHQKLYDFRQGHSLLEPRYLQRSFPSKDTAKVWSPWNAEKLSRANYWDTHRTLAAFHVYVHVALVSLIADQRASDLEEVYRGRRGMIDSRKALDRARYLGEQLKTFCWDELGFAGKALVDWLTVILNLLDPSPAPAGAYFHFLLELYDKESTKVESLLNATQSRGSTVRHKLSFLAKEEIEAIRQLLTTIHANQTLEEFNDVVSKYANAALGANFSHVRRLIASTLRGMSPNGFGLPTGPSGSVDSNDLVRQMVRSASQQLYLTLEGLPDAVVAAKHRAEAFGFTKACVDRVGRLLASLAAAVPEGGRILEIGTGVGVGTAWISAGLGQRIDTEVISVEIDHQLSDAARSWPWSGNVRILTADVIELFDTCGTFDLVFADAYPNKIDYIEAIIKLVRPGGFLLIDDLKTNMGTSKTKAEKDALRDLLLRHRDLQTVELEWASGVILSVVKRPSSLLAGHVDDVRPLGYVAERYRSAARSRKPAP
ncbi:MAG: O-methyltransferase [Candidatus Binataceae bacterium]